MVRDRLVDRMKETAAGHGVWFSDISDVFKDEKAQVYLDDTHLTSRGAEIVAERPADLKSKDGRSRHERSLRQSSSVEPQ